MVKSHERWTESGVRAVPEAVTIRYHDVTLSTALPLA